MRERERERTTPNPIQREREKEREKDWKVERREGNGFSEKETIKRERRKERAKERDNLRETDGERVVNDLEGCSGISVMLSMSS